MTARTARKRAARPRRTAIPDLGDLWRGPYPERLRAAWRAHRAPRQPGAPTVVSLFAGAGGSSLGYSIAGYDERLAVEWDAHACATFRANFPGVPMREGDITTLGDAEALRLARLEPGELDLLDGSPPCQGFSTGGRRDIGDPRNLLFREYVRLLRAFRPRAFVMENVSGLVKGKMRLLFAEMLAELKASGYAVSARLLDAKYFGVPQSRHRLIFVGARADLGVAPSHPEATVTRAVTVWQAWEGVVPSEPPQGFSPKYVPLVQRIRPGENASDHHPDGNGFQNLIRLHWERPSPTVTKDTSGRGYSTFLHPKEHRNVSISECQRLQSFPDGYALEGRFVDKWARIGNSVPPLMAAAIAAHVRREVLRK